MLTPAPAAQATKGPHASAAAAVAARPRRAPASRSTRYVGPAGARGSTARGSTAQGSTARGSTARGSTAAPTLRRALCSPWPQGSARRARSLWQGGPCFTLNPNFTLHPNASNSSHWANSNLNSPATCFIALGRAAEPTRDTQTEPRARHLHTGGPSSRGAARPQVHLLRGRRPCARARCGCRVQGAAAASAHAPVMPCSRRPAGAHHALSPTRAPGQASRPAPTPADACSLC
jgi:hypothetical protein